MGAILAAAVGVLTLATAAPAADVETDRRAAVDRATTALAAKKAHYVITTIDPVIAAYEADLRAETRTLYCGMTPAQTLAYMMLAANMKKAALALAPTFCQALYLKGFALFDLGRIAEAQAIYKRLVTLAPMHAHFRLELGMTYRVQRDWQTMFDTCKSAEDVAGLAPKDRVNAEKGFAWRCMGFALIEQGKLDEAEKLFRQCLALDPNDAKARNELDYIAQERRKAVRS